MSLDWGCRGAGALAVQPHRRRSATSLTAIVAVAMTAVGCSTLKELYELDSEDEDPLALDCPSSGVEFSEDEALATFMLSEHYDPSYEIYGRNFSWQSVPISPRISLNRISFGEDCSRFLSEATEDDLYLAMLYGLSPWSFSPYPVAVTHLREDTTSETYDNDAYSVVYCSAGIATEGDGVDGPPMVKTLATTRRWSDSEMCGTTNCDITIYSHVLTCTDPVPGRR